MNSGRVLPISVLKCRFCCYSDMVRATDQEMITIEKIVCYLQSLKGGGTPHHRGSHSEVPGSMRRQKEWQENVSKSFYCGFHGKEWVKEGKQV